jgi:cell division septal protein FtsQ
VNIKSLVASRGVIANAGLSMSLFAFARLRFVRLLVLGLSMWCLTSLMAVAQSAVLVVDAFNRKVHVAGNANTNGRSAALPKSLRAWSH